LQIVRRKTEGREEIRTLGEWLCEELFIDFDVISSAHLLELPIAPRMPHVTRTALRGDER